MIIVNLGPKKENNHLKTPIIIQVYHGNIVHFVPDHCNKANTTIRRLQEIFCSLVHIKIIFAL